MILRSVILFTGVVHCAIGTNVITPGGFSCLIVGFLLILAYEYMRTNPPAANLDEITDGAECDT
jgi:hypothetical protein